jgi:hypothetical protein
MAEQPEPMAQMMAAWRQATDTYLSAWNRALESMAQMPEAEQATGETSKTMLGSRAAANEVTRQAIEPMIELAGGVTMSEFRRLMDAVHGIHLRMDMIEDQLRSLTAEPKKPKRKKKAE